MKDNTNPGIAIVVTVISFAAGLFIGSLGQRSAVRAEAIQAGAAEWTITKDGQPQFKWKGCK